MVEEEKEEEKKTEPILSKLIDPYRSFQYLPDKQLSMYEEELFENHSFKGQKKIKHAKVHAFDPESFDENKIFASEQGSNKSSLVISSIHSESVREQSEFGNNVQLHPPRQATDQSIMAKARRAILTKLNHKLKLAKN